MGGYPLKDRKNLKKAIRDLAENESNDAAIDAKIASGSGAPDANLDINDGILVGTIYVDTDTGALYVCTDNTATAAQWATVGSGGSSQLWRYGGPALLTTISVANGIAVEIGADGAPGTTVVTVADFYPVVKSPNAEIVPAFGIALTGSPKPDMYEDPEEASIQIDCNSDAQTIVDIWVEESGIPQNVYTQTYLLVQDNGGACAGP